MVSTLPRFRIVALAIVLLVVQHTSVSADSPNLVPRMILVEQTVAQPCPTWDSDSSIALLIGQTPTDANFVRFGPQDPAVIVEQLLLNQPQLLDDPELLDVLLSLVSVSLTNSDYELREARHITSSGPQQQIVYWPRNAPRTGVALSGPSGDVYTLGTFGFRRISPITDPVNCPGASYCGTWEMRSSGAERFFCIAVGWFRQ